MRRVWGFAGLLALLCAPSQVSWPLGLGRRHIWGQGTGTHRKGVFGGTWAREQHFQSPRRGCASSQPDLLKQAGCSCILDKWGMGRRKACRLPPQWCCGRLVSSKMEGMGQGWQEEKGLCRESSFSDCLLGSSVMFSKLWASLDTCEMWSGFSDSYASCYYPSIWICSLISRIQQRDQQCTQPFTSLKFWENLPRTGRAAPVCGSPKSDWIKHLGMLHPV